MKLSLHLSLGHADHTHKRTHTHAVMIKALTTPSSISSRVSSFTATRATRCCRALCIGVLTGAFCVGRVGCAATAILAGRDCCKGQRMNPKLSGRRLPIPIHPDRRETKASKVVGGRVGCAVTANLARSDCRCCVGQRTRVQHLFF